MSDLINGRTPEEIKRWISSRVKCETCPQDGLYGCEYGERTEDCQMCIDALAFIERLEAQRPKWIPVRDQIPELDRMVVFGYSDKQFIYIGYLSSDELEWLGYDDNRVARPSHWMPLPNPPKEDAT